MQEKSKKITRYRFFHRNSQQRLPMGTHSRGFTLVELLIALALGFTVLTATMVIFVESRETFRFIQNSRELHEQGRHALLFLADEIRKAETISGTEGDGENGSDSITIAYDGIKDCQDSAKSSVQYLIKDESLKCPSQGMIDNVEGLQFLYGIDEDGDQSVNRYQNAAQVTDWTQVRSVQIALLIRSEEPIRQTPDTTRYTLLSADYEPYNDLYLRRVYQLTVALRNRP